MGHKRHERQDWAYELDGVIADAVQKIHVSKGAITSALGFGNLSLSTITRSDEWHGRLCSAFAAPHLPRFAARLGLGPERYLLAEKFFEDALLVLLGYRVSIKASRAEHRETRDWESAGSEAYALGNLTVAEAYFSEAWINLRSSQLHSPQNAKSKGEQLLQLTVGRQLLSLNALLGTTEAAKGMLTEIERLALSILRDTKTSVKGELLSLAGAALTQVAVAHRLLRTMNGVYIANYSEMAYEVLSSRKLYLSAQLCGLRDQAKPLLSAAFQATDPAQAKSLIDRAASVLAKADELAGGQHPNEELREAWLQTRLTQVEYLTLFGSSDAARREWELIRNQTWLDNFLKEREKIPICAKIQTTKMAVTASEGRLDELGQLAEDFLSDPEHAIYGHRLRQVLGFKQYAISGDLARLHQALLE